MDKDITIKQALKKKDIWAVYQPVVSFDTGKIFSYEVLARSRVPKCSNPVALFERALKEKQCGFLGRSVRKMASKGCQDSILFVNIHPHELDEEWLIRPDDPIFSHPMPIYMEITESIPITHFKFCNTVLAEIRAKGICIAIDDLGAGYSNLKYISDLEPEIVKIDKELIMGIDSNSRLQTLVTNVVKLCHDLGAKVVVEGVENVEELKASRDTGADFAQGFYLARPEAVPPPVKKDLIII